MPSLIRIISEDIRGHGNGSILPSLGMLPIKPNLKCLIWWRLSMAAHSSGLKIIRGVAMAIRAHIIQAYSCDLSPSATVGRRIRLCHPIGIVIGDGTIIGDDVWIWQNVTIGSHGKNGLTAEYPVIKNNVRIYASAIVIGGIEVGHGSVIGCATLVRSSVANGVTYVGR